MTAHNLDDLGAWMVKCNPAVFDIEAARTVGKPITSWTVTPSYRTELMAAGQRILLWVTGSAGACPTPGVWGVGTVAGRIFTQSPGHDPGFWLDEAERQRQTTFVPVDIALFDAPVDRDALRCDARLPNLEILRQPKMSNPLWVTRDEYARLERYLPVVAGPDDSARAIVASAYHDLGWQVDDVHTRWPGLDLVCTAPNGHVLHLATRAAPNDRPTALLTRADIDAAGRDPHWRLAVVRQLWTRPSIDEVDAETTLGLANPCLYEVNIPNQ